MFRDVGVRTKSYECTTKQLEKDSVYLLLQFRQVEEQGKETTEDMIHRRERKDLGVKWTGEVRSLSPTGFTCSSCLNTKDRRSTQTDFLQ